MRREPATMRGSVVGLVWCALLLMLENLAGMEWLRAVFLLTLGPIIGAIAHRCWGGRGILGGVIGGLASYIGFVLFVYLWVYLYPEPNSVDYVGPGLTLIVGAFEGAGVGLVVGILIWEVMRIKGPWGESSKPIEDPEQGVDVPGLLELLAKRDPNSKRAADRTGQRSHHRKPLVES